MLRMCKNCILKLMVTNSAFWGVSPDRPVKIRPCTLRRRRGLECYTIYVDFLEYQVHDDESIKNRRSSRDGIDLKDALKKFYEKSEIELNKKIL